MSRVDFAVVFTAFLPLLLWLLFVAHSARSIRTAACLFVATFCGSFIASICVLDTALIAAGRTHYELHQQPDGTRAWKYVENKKGN